MWYRGLSAGERVALKQKRIAFWKPKGRLSLLSAFVAPQWVCVVSRSSDWLEWAVEAADAVSVKRILTNKHLSGDAVHRVVTEPTSLFGSYKWFLVGEHPNVLPETVAEVIVSDGLIPLARSRNVWGGLRWLRDSVADWRVLTFVTELVSVCAFAPDAVSAPVIAELQVKDLKTVFGRNKSELPSYMVKAFVNKLLAAPLSKNAKDLLAVIVGSSVVDMEQREEAFNRLYALPEVRVEFAGLPVGWVRRSFGFE